MILPAAMLITAKNKGYYGENLAKRFLITKGYTILQENYRRGRREVDLIVRQGSILVFIEVKTRITERTVEVDQAFSPRQEAELKKILRCYLIENPIEFSRARLDLILITINKKTGVVRLKHYHDLC